MGVTGLILLGACALMTSVKAADDTAALFKPSVMSSVYRAADSAPSNANDGNRDGVYNHHSVALTTSEVQPWYVIDLLVPMTVTGGVVTNRVAAPERLVNGVLAVGDGFDASIPGSFDPTSFAICAENINNLGGGVPIDFSCDPQRTGRYVVFYLRTTGYLQIAEVEVTVARNPLRIVSLLKPAFSSSTYSLAWLASNVVDGSGNAWGASCFASKEQENPWIAIDLLSTYRVRFVTIKNRQDAAYERFFDTYVYVDTTLSLPGDIPLKTARLCDYLPGPYSPGQVVLATCDGKPRGRFVAVYQAAPALMNLCEITVFA